MTVTANLARDSDAGVQSTDAAFRSSLQTSCNQSDFDFQSLQNELLNQLDLFTNLGSGWSLISIDDFIVHVVCYNPLVGSSYMELP